MHLIGLCGLITEFIDEILGLFYHLLLILVSGNLLLHTLHFLSHVGQTLDIDRRLLPLS